MNCRVCEASRAEKIRSLIDRLKHAGLHLRGDATLFDQLVTQRDWRAGLTSRIATGRRKGLALQRITSQLPPDARVEAILRDYAFSAVEMLTIVQNLAALPIDQYRWSVRDAIADAKQADRVTAIPE